MARIAHNEKTIMIDNVKLDIVFSRPLTCTNTQNEVEPHYAFHTHPHFELYIIQYGSGYIITPDSKRVKIEKNSVIIVPPNLMHARYHTPGTESRLLCINFNYSKNKQMAKSGKLYAYMHKHLPKDRDIFLLKDKFFGQFCENIASQYEADTLLASLLTSNLLEGLFLRILRVCNKTDGYNEDAWIYKYKTAAIKNEVTLSKDIDDFMNDPECTLNALASHLDMSTRTVQRIIKSIYGGSYSEIITKKRLELAIEYMKNKHLSLIEISQIVGYNQYPSFRKAFIRKYGISPKHYRNNIHNQV